MYFVSRNRFLGMSKPSKSKKKAKKAIQARWSKHKIDPTELPTDIEATLDSSLQSSDCGLSLMRSGVTTIASVPEKLLTTDDISQSNMLKTHNCAEESPDTPTKRNSCVVM
jgi:hypothetical protein